MSVSSILYLASAVHETSWLILCGWSWLENNQERWWAIWSSGHLSYSTKPEVGSTICMHEESILSMNTLKSKPMEHTKELWASWASSALQPLLVPPSALHGTAYRWSPFRISDQAHCGFRGSVLLNVQRTGCWDADDQDRSWIKPAMWRKLKKRQETGTAA